MTLSNAGMQGLRPGVVTSTTRPTTPYTGQIIYETDTGFLRVWDGSAWDYLSAKQDTTTNLPVDTIGRAWETWTPNFVPETGAWTTVTLNFARYGRIQKFVFGEVLFTINNFGTGNGAVSFTLPVPARVGNPNALGVGREAALTGQTFNVWRTGVSTAAIRFYANASTANGNYMYPFNFFYEAA